MSKKINVGPDYDPMTVKEIAKYTGLNTNGVNSRMHRGITGKALLEKADFTNVTKKYVVGSGRPSMSITEIVNLTGLSPSVVRTRIKYGLTGKALFAPAQSNSQAKIYNVGPDRPPMTIAEIVALTGLNSGTVHQRLKRGLTGKALFAPAQKKNRSQVYDVGPNHPPMTITQISEFTGINRSTIANRIFSYHMTGERLLVRTNTRPNAKVSRDHRFDVGPDHPPMTAKEISERTGLSLGSIDNRIRKGWHGAELLKPNLKPRRSE